MAAVHPTVTFDPTLRALLPVHTGRVKENSEEEGAWYGTKRSEDEGLSA